jgi:LysM repeat protein
MAVKNKDQNSTFSRLRYLDKQLANPNLSQKEIKILKMREQNLMDMLEDGQDTFSKGGMVMEKGKKMPLPKPKPRHANPKHPMNTEKTKPLGRNKGGKMPLPISPRQMAEKKLKENYELTSMFIRDDEALKKKQNLQKTLLGKVFGSGSGKDIRGRKFAKEEAVNMLKKESPELVKRLTKKASGGLVKVGEKGTAKTLSQIAAQNNVSLRDLLSANPSIKNANKIRLGQSINLPSTKMTGSSIGATRNPYKNMSKKDMADMDVKNKSAERQQAVTKRSRVSALDELKAKSKAPKAMPKLGEIKADAEDTQKYAPSEPPRRKDIGSIKSATTAENKRLDEMRVKARSRADRRMGGGAMKKKVQGYKSGGMCRGGGAATKGRRYGRSG